MNESRQNTGRGRPRIISEKEIERWINTYGEDIRIVDYKKRGIKYSLIARERGLISEDEEFAYFLLYGSVNSRINNTKHGDEYYRSIKCEWSNPEETVEQIIKCKPEMWLEWKRLTSIYLEKGKLRGLRPSIDRIDEKQGYTLANVAALSQHDNTSRAKARPHYVFKIFDSTNPDKSQSFCKYQTKRDALNSLGLPQSHSDTGRFFQIENSLYLVQSEDVTWGRRKLEDYEMNMDLSYSGWLPVSITPVGDKQVKVVRIPFTFEQMAIVLKEPIAE